MVETLLRVVVSLGIVLVLLSLTARAASRRFRTPADAPLRVLHRQPLSRSASIAVVGVGERVLVLGATDQQVSVLAELDAQEAAAWTPEPEPSPEPGAEPPVGRHAAPGAGRTPYAGSLLSPQTWRQALTALTGRTS